MQLLELYRYLHSYLTITVSGGFTERFINLCNRNRLYLWDIRYIDGHLSAKLKCKDFFKLRDIRRKTGVKIKTEKKCGLYFFLKKNKKRRALMYGLLFSVCFMIIMNQFVWIIDVTGNQSLSKTEIINLVNDIGLKTGSFTLAVDTNKAGREMVNLSDGRILWASVNIKGSIASVEIREKGPEEPQKPNGSSPCNIVADFDAVILSDKTYSGVSYVSRGSAVKTGDILISGISENADGSVNFHKADGKLTALHTVSLSSSSAENRKSDKIISSVYLDSLEIFSLKIPLSLNKLSGNSADYEYTKYLKLNGRQLPFGIKKSVKTTTVEGKEDYKMLICLIDEFTQKEYDRFENSCITVSEYSFVKENDEIILNGTYECIDFIGKKCDILQEN